jgi:hypothetical protein
MLRMLCSRDSRITTWKNRSYRGWRCPGEVPESGKERQTATGIIFHGGSSLTRAMEKEEEMPGATRSIKGTTSLSILHLAFELGAKEWKPGSSEGLSRAPRLQRVEAGKLLRLEGEIEAAKRCFGFPPEAKVLLLRGGARRLLAPLPPGVSGDSNPRGGLIEHRGESPEAATQELQTSPVPSVASPRGRGTQAVQRRRRADSGSGGPTPSSPRDRDAGVGTTRASGHGEK